VSFLLDILNEPVGRPGWDSRIPETFPVKISPGVGTDAPHDRHRRGGYKGGMRAGNKTVGVRLRIVLEPNVAIGPGKADILEGIKATGSIAAAGRRMGMSYKRAWLLVETMNASFKAPLVETSRGGRAHGGAVLSPEGEAVLAAYRRMEALSNSAVADEMAALRRLSKGPADGE
jgi:molybdate transport system regulatory protein